MKVPKSKIAPRTRTNKSFGASNPSTLLSSLGAFGLGATKLTDPYKQYVWSYACIKLIATASSGIPLKFYNHSDQSLIEDIDNPFVRLFDMPNPLLIGSAFWQLVSIYYEDFGQVFVVMRDKDYFKPIERGQTPETLEVVDPRQIEPRVEGGMFKGWKYTKSAGAGTGQGSSTYVENLEIFQVLRFFQMSPDGILSALAPSTPASVSITSDMKAHSYNDKFFENGGQIAGVLEASGANFEDLDPEEVDEIRANWDSRFSGEQQAHRTPVLTGGLKYTRTGATQKDMDFKDMLVLSREEVLASYGVPKTKVGLTDKVDRAVAKVFDRQFYQDNVVPKLRQWEQILNATMLRDSGFYCAFDTSVVEALNEDRNDSIDGATKLSELGFAINDINEKQNLGMEPVTEKWGDDAVDTRNTGTTASNDEPDDDETDTDDTSEESDEDAKGITGANKQKFTIPKRYDKASVSSLPSEEVFAEMNDQDFNDLYLATVLEGKNTEAYAKKLMAYFRELETAQMSLIEQLKDSKVSIIKNEAYDEYLFDSEKWDKLLIKDSKKYLENAFADSADFLEAEIGGFTGFEFESDPNIQKELERKLIRVTGVNETVKESIRSAILAGNAENETIQEITERVRHSFTVARHRALTIARTEVGQSASASRFTAMSAEGLKKRWVSANDGVVRANHLEYASEGTHEMGYDYAKGDNLKHPCDMDCKDASEVINCRCIIRAVKN